MRPEERPHYIRIFYDLKGAMMGCMKKILTLSAPLSLAFMPAVASAASVQSILGDAMSAINSVLLPLLFSLAFLFFLYNAFRYFFLTTDEASRAKARTFALWSIIAFVLMVSVWGIVNLLVSGLGISGSRPVCPDYLSVSECRAFQNSHQWEEETNL